MKKILNAIIEGSPSLTSSAESVTSFLRTSAVVPTWDHKWLWRFLFQKQWLMAFPFDFSQVKKPQANNLYSRIFTDYSLNPVYPRFQYV